MSKIDFDEHSPKYRETLRSSLGVFGKDDTFFDVYKILCIKNLVADNNQVYDILDYGCGIGKLTGLLAKDFQRSTVYGYDISIKSLSVAKGKCGKLKNVYFIGELSREQKYDFIIAANIFHHIEPDDRVSILLKMKNLLKSGGKIVVFEHNPLNPLTQYIVSKCPFDEDAKLIRRHKFIRLAAGCGLKIDFKRYIVFFPWPSNLFRKVEYLLRQVPLGAQYMLIMAQK